MALLMKNLFVSIVLVATLVPLAVHSQQSSGTLAGFLSKQGLAAARLERRGGNHLFFSVSVKKQGGALMIDTGSPNTVIDVNKGNTIWVTFLKKVFKIGGFFVPV